LEDFIDDGTVCRVASVVPVGESDVFHTVRIEAGCAEVAGIDGVLANADGWIRKIMRSMLA